MVALNSNEMAERRQEANSGMPPGSTSHHTGTGGGGGGNSSIKDASQSSSQATRHNKGSLSGKKNKSSQHSVVAVSDQFYQQQLQLQRSIQSLENRSLGGNSFHNGDSYHGGAGAAGPGALARSQSQSSVMSAASMGGGPPHHMSCMDTCIDYIQQFRYHCGVFVNHKNTQFLVVYLIAINALMMGIATFPFVKENPDVEDAFELTDRIFLIIFTIELAMQFAFYGWRMFTDGWLVFDTVIIVSSWCFQEVQIIRAFRIFRAFRLITRITVLKNLVLALFGVMPRMFAIFLLLMLVSYIFAVMFTQLFKDLYKDGLTDENYFGRMDHTLFTLFQLMTMDAWADIARQVMDVYAWAWLPLITFVVITGFVVVNLIIAVICDAISALRDDEKAKLHGTYEEHESESSSESGGGSAAGEGSETEGGEGGEHSSSHHHRGDTTSPGGGGRRSHDEDEDDEDVAVHLDALEDQVEELARMQEESLMALEKLTRQLQAHRLPELPAASSSSASSSPRAASPSWAASPPLVKNASYASSTDC